MKQWRQSDGHGDTVPGAAYRSETDIWFSMRRGNQWWGKQCKVVREVDVTCRSSGDFSERISKATTSNLRKIKKNKTS